MKILHCLRNTPISFARLVFLSKMVAVTASIASAFLIGIPQYTITVHGEHRQGLVTKGMKETKLLAVKTGKTSRTGVRKGESQAGECAPDLSRKTESNAMIGEITNDWIDNYASAVPDGYHTQDGCGRCVHCFVVDHYDSGPDYYCTFDKVERPECPEGVEGECDPTIENFCIWNDWKYKRVVSQTGICPHFLSRPFERE